MELNAKIPLSLSKTRKQIVLKYDTFEQASFDQYLIASLILNSNSEKQREQYINDITGKGSLNEHFKKLLKKIELLTDDQLHKILDNSLFPITRIDKSHYYDYFHNFNVSMFNNKTYAGDLSSEMSLKDMIFKENEMCTFRSIETEEANVEQKKNNYNCLLSENEIKVDLGDGVFWKIDESVFNQLYQPELLDLTNFNGNIRESISDGNWYCLTQKILNELEKTKYFYYDEGDFVQINNDSVVVNKIMKVFNIYFFSNKRIMFNKDNKNICERVLKELIDKSKIYNFSPNGLVLLIKSLDIEKQQYYINLILGKIKNKLLSRLGIELLINGVNKNWDSETLREFKQFINPSEIMYLYKADDTLDYSLQDIINIPDYLLNEKHRVQKEEYEKNRNNMLDEINKMIGEITTSGVREKIKSLKQKDNVLNKFKKFMNDNVGHNKKEYTALSMDQLTHEYNLVKSVYNNDFQKIKDRCEKNQK